jgi:cell division transport system permease protein
MLSGGRLGRLRQALRRMAKGMAGAPGHSALVILTLCAALLVVGLYGMALHNVQNLLGHWGRAGNIGCFLADGSTAEQWETARASLAALPGAAKAELVTPGQALARFAERGPSAKALVEGVGEEVLPAMVELFVAGGFTEAAAVKELAQQAEKVPLVASVDVGAAQFAALRALVHLLRLGGWVFGSAVLMAAALVCANTIRLVVQAQSDEIAILRQVGGTAHFVRLPYVLQGVVWGALSGTLVGGILYLLDWRVAPRLTQAAAAFTGDLSVRLFHPPLVAALLLCGMLLGALGSAVAVQRTLSAESI